jgi:hypothetical protein
MGNASQRVLLILGVWLFFYSHELFAHVKWFVEFDLSDPPQSFTEITAKFYYLSLLVLSLWGIIIALLLDYLWKIHFGHFSFLEKTFSQYNDIALNIARIGTGMFFVAIWLVGDIILSPELITNTEYVAYIQLIIAFSVLSKRSLFIAGIGILLLYGTAIYEYGLFHLLDYVTLVGLAIYLILSSTKFHRFNKYRLPILYYGLIFSFLWSAIEKIAYPQWFYPFLEKYPFLTMDLDTDLFIACAAFVEFTLFFLLLISRNGVVLLALLINLLISAGNIYFGKIDAIGHFPANFILLIMLVQGSLRSEIQLPYNNCYLLHHIFKGLSIYLIVLAALVSSYYGIHWIIYDLQWLS